MTSKDIRSKFITFYKSRKHASIPSAPLVPENDPTTLFTSCGMQPLVPYILGQPHPLGRRLVNIQKSFRAEDIDEVGDNRHTTFFEMLGNWSFGDYFKHEQLPWIFEFLTKELSLNPEKLYVSVFEGDDLVPRDTESIEIWKEIFLRVGIRAEEENRIFSYPVKQNWWSRSGPPSAMPPGEPGGPDSEVFFDLGEEKMLHNKSQWKNEPCSPNCQCGRFIEVANSVFMEYQKDRDGSIKELKQKNVDFGGGLERMLASVNNTPDVFKTDLFLPIIKVLEDISGRNYSQDIKTQKAMQIIADHIRASVMMMSDGVVPSNKMQGCVLRRLIRRSIVYGRNLGLKKESLYLPPLVSSIVSIYKDAYPEVEKSARGIEEILCEEANRFSRALDKGLREIEKADRLDGAFAFKLYESFGFPWEMTVEIAKNRGQVINKQEFEKEYAQHKELSRTAAKGMFKGGLADKSEKTKKLHTATHLLHQALRTVLGSHVEQKGSHITSERLRFDFTHHKQITEEEKKKVEDLINEIIKENAPVTSKVLSLDDARKSGALGLFQNRYGEKVMIYSIGSSKCGETSFSMEICGGPHVSFTGDLGHFTIEKEQSISGGVRRIYATIQEKTEG